MSNVRGMQGEMYFSPFRVSCANNGILVELASYEGEVMDEISRRLVFNDLDRFNNWLKSYVRTNEFVFEPPFVESI